MIPTNFTRGYGMHVASVASIDAKNAVTIAAHTISEPFRFILHTCKTCRTAESMRENEFPYL